MTLLRDVFDIPEKVDSSDFVLQLVQGVEAAERTLADYVVTDALAESIDDALSLVQRTVEGGSSKGAFVHGSFGSGKSHFMAVLHLLLTGNTQARALKGLQEVVARRRAVLDANLLAIDYHLLGKESFEGALFEGYLDAVRRLHPGAELPVLHQSDGLLSDAAGMRASMGDDAFFAGLNAGSQESSGWGRRATAWDGATFDAAAAAPIGDPQRDRLVNTLVATHFSSYRRAGEWLETAAGLRAMTEHARGLGYDGVVLFLDELVLWLAQHLSNKDFIREETSKVAKLVETEMATLPLPIISFVARQRDLSDFLGGDAVGAEQAAISQSFTWWEDRFERIQLQAADLPQIVQRRLLTPVNDEAAAKLAAAVARVHADSAAWGYLLTDANKSSGADFALTYPFSPALVDAMIALSALMQRERTALRLMGELLSNGRDELTVDDVIPVGDLFEVAVLDGVPPLTPQMRQHFDHAREFYQTRMRPYLLDKHGLDEAGARGLPRTHGFRTEDRLAKTLLVASLAPGAPSLTNLTFAKLAALNYGTITSFVPGQQAQTVMTMVRDWQTQFGEVRVGEGSDPIVSIALTGINTDVLIETVQSEDTVAHRRELVRNLLAEQLGVTAQSGLLADRTHTVTWRGSKREVDVVFGNIRDENELTTDALRAAPGRWKLVIDFPFDTGNHTPQEDLNRLIRVRESGIESTTLAWIPHFLTTARMADVGKLYLLEYLLTGERFEQAARGLNPGDREPARQALDNNRRSLRTRVLDALHQAYGAAAANAENVETQIQASEVFTSLVPGLSIQPPVAPSLRGALDSALRQGLDHQYPDHPEFQPTDSEVSRRELTTVLDLAREAVDSGGRLEGIERAKAATLRRVALPLRLGSPRETVYALAPDSFGWLSEFTRWTADTSGEVRVSDLRSRMRGYGMLPEVEDLLILVWSALEDREWVRAGTRVDAPGIGQVSGDMSLRPARLPSIEEWTRALRAAQALFGASPQPRRSAASAARLARDVRDAVSRLRDPAARLLAVLTERADLLGMPESGPGRWATAQEGAALVDALSRETDDTLLLQVLADADLPAEPQAMATSLSTAGELATALVNTDWELLGSARSLPDQTGQQILADLADVAGQEELHAPLRPAVRDALTRVRDELIARRPAPAPSGDQDAGGGAAVPTGGGGPAYPSPSGIPRGGDAAPAAVNVDEIVLDLDDGEAYDAALDRMLGSLRAASRANPGRRLKVRWWLE